MPRKLLIRTPDFPYHITNRSNNKDFFYIDKSLLWDIFMNCLNELINQYGCDMHGFVLMSNHYHLIISTPRENIGDAMKYFHREVARQANKSTGRVNHFFGGRYKWSIVSNEDYYWNGVKYIFRNPVRAGICSDVTDYEFSSLNKNTPLFNWKMIDYFAVDKSLIELNTDWLNEPFSKENEAAVGKALKRREFKVPRGKSGRESFIETARYKKGTVT